MKNLFQKVLLLVCVVIMFFCATRGECKEAVSTVYLNNVEALANGESSIDGCIGRGSVDCYGYKVSYIIGGYNRK